MTLHDIAMAELSEVTAQAPRNSSLDELLIDCGYYDDKPGLPTVQDQVILTALGTDRLFANL